MRGASPGSFHSTGRAINSPSRSRSTISATTIAGRAPWRASALRPRTIAPSVSRFLSSAFSAPLSSPLTPKARATSRLVTRFGSAAPSPPLAMKATTSSREGRAPATGAVRERGLGRAAVLDGLLTGNFWVWMEGEGSAPVRLSTIGGPPLQAKRSGGAGARQGVGARLPITSRVKRLSGDSSRRSINSASGWAAIQSPTAA